MGDPEERRYGDDPQLRRATLWAVAGVSAAIALVVLVITAIALFFVGRVAAGLSSGDERWQPVRSLGAWGAVSIMLLTFLVCVISLVRLPSRRQAADRSWPVDADHPASQALERLSSLAAMDRPDLVVVDGPGRNAVVLPSSPGEPARIGVTRSLLADLSAPQIEAVLAHELAHLSQGDTVLAYRLAAVVATSERSLPEPLKPLVRNAIDALLRQRELSADRSAVLLTGRPNALLEALARCTGTATRPPADLRAAASVAFVPVVRPYRSERRTHPSPDEREQVVARAAAQLGQR